MIITIGGVDYYAFLYHFVVNCCGRYLVSEKKKKWFVTINNFAAFCVVTTMRYLYTPTSTFLTQ